MLSDKSQVHPSVQNFELPKEYIDHNSSTGRKLSYNVKTLAGTLGGVFGEYYDFTLIMVCYPILGKLFFPPSDDMYTVIIRGMAVGAASNIFRPIGGYLFGKFADKFGRVRSMSVTIAIMSTVTVLMGMLPTFETWGYFSLAALMFLRIMQGIAVSGEFAVSLIYLQEKFPKYSVLASMSSFCAAYLAMALAGLSFAAVSRWAEVTEHYWRIPFILSGLFAILSIYLRRKLYEGVAFVEYKKTGPKTDNFWKNSIKNKQLKSILLIMLILTIFQMANEGGVRILNPYLQCTTSMSQADVAFVGGMCSLVTVLNVGIIALIYQFYIYGRYSAASILRLWIIPAFFIMLTGFHLISIGNIYSGIFILTAGNDMISVTSVMWITYLPITIKARAVGIATGFAVLSTKIWMGPTFIAWVKNGGTHYFMYFFLFGAMLVAILLTTFWKEFSQIGLFYKRKEDSHDVTKIDDAQLSV